MARRLPGGGIFRGTYAPKAISYDKPEGDYMKMLAIGKEVLPVADKLLTPLIHDTVKGVGSAIGSLFEGGTEKVQADIKKSEATNRSAVANKMLGNVPDVTLEQPSLLKDKPEPQKKRKAFPATRQNEVTSEYLRSLGLKSGTRAWKEAYLSLMEKAENLPEDVWTDLTDAQVRRLYEDPSYTGEDLVRDIKEVEESVAEQPMLPDPMQRQAPAFDQFKDVRLDPAVSRAESVQQSRMNQIRGKIEREIDRLEESNILPRRQSYHDAIDLYNRGKIANIPDELLYLRDLKEKEKLEGIAPKLEPAQRGVPEAKREADAQVEELYAGVTETKDPVKSVETAVEVVKSTPGGVSAQQDFERGFVRSIDKLPFSQVRAMATLGDPRRMTSRQISAFAERYRDEATPLSLVELFSGAHKKRAEEQMRKEIGLYAGVTTKEERRQTAADAAAGARERLKQSQKNLRKQADIEMDMLEYGLDKIKTQSDVSKAASEVVNNYANANYRQSGVRLREAQIKELTQKTRQELVKANREQLKWNRYLRSLKRGANPNKVRVEPRMLMRSGKLTLVPGITMNGRWLAGDSRAFQEAEKKLGVKMTRKQREKFILDMKSSKTLSREPSAGKGPLLPSKGEISGQVNVVNTLKSNLNAKIKRYAGHHDLVKDKFGAYALKDQSTKLTRKLSDITLKADSESEANKAFHSIQKDMADLAEAEAKLAKLRSPRARQGAQPQAPADSTGGDDESSFDPQSMVKDITLSAQLQGIPAAEINARKEEQLKLLEDIEKLSAETGLGEDVVLHLMNQGKVYNRRQKKWGPPEDEDL